MKKLSLIVMALLITSCGPSVREISPAIEKVSKRVESAREFSDQKIPQPQAGQLTAGEFNDLKHWDFWKKLSDQSQWQDMSQYWNYNTDNRIFVRLTNNKKPLIDIPVSIVSEENDVTWEARTDNKGEAQLWLNSYQQNNNINVPEFKLSVDGVIYKGVKIFDKAGVNEIDLQDLKQENRNDKVDIAFMIDATGSMQDEIDYLKSELLDVINRIQNKHSQTQINMGSVFYRDHGDDYVVKTADFSSRISKTIDFISGQNAEGGGDFPEAVDEALDVAINDLNWSTYAKARVLFMVLDAPPHYNNNVITRIHKLIRAASKKGIKLIPVMASGVDKETEFLMRYMAIATNGTYVFITDDSGIGNDHIEASVGPHRIEYLNQLMERIILENLE